MSRPYVSASSCTAAQSARRRVELLKVSPTSQMGRHCAVSIFAPTNDAHCKRCLELLKTRRREVVELKVDHGDHGEMHEESLRQRRRIQNKH